ncbi:MAG: phosphatidylserine decarboxylase [Campylobacteraceae bacterium]|nr:phosphatidylserine decarboxylase [Campylobacteraceae bacterium]
MINVFTTTQIFVREGWNQILLTLMIFILSYVLSFLPWLFFLIFVFTLFIYRNPERIQEEEDELCFVAPIDGKVIEIGKVKLGDGSEVLKLVIKKTIFDVGVIRAPMALSIVDIKKRFGLFLPSASPLFRILGEHSILTCKGKFARIVIIINAGVLSRTIELFKTLGALKSSERFAYLADGQVVMLLPLDARVKVSINDDVKAGTSVLGYFAYKVTNDK